MVKTCTNTGNLKILVHRGGSSYERVGDLLAKLLAHPISFPALTLDIEGSADRQMDWAKTSGKHDQKEKPRSEQKDANTQQKELSKDQAVDDNQLMMLAQTRANMVKDYLIQNANVAAERVQLKPVKIIAKTKKSMPVRMTSEPGVNGRDYEKQKLKLCLTVSVF